MRSLTVGVACLAIAWLTATSSANAASFNCARASHNVEYLICGDPVLSDLDDQLAAFFAAARRQTSNPAQLSSGEELPGPLPIMVDKQSQGRAAIGVNACGTETAESD